MPEDVVDFMVDTVPKEEFHQVRLLERAQQVESCTFTVQFVFPFELFPDQIDTLPKSYYLC